MSINVFGVTHKDDTVRAASSSGGVFYAIAQETIAKGGHVYGAELIAGDNGGWSCRHVKCDHIQDLDRILKSKYMPSMVEHVFPEIQTLLQQNESVLFCATPCQVAGLLSYLGKEYENLTTVDFICHGVPTPLLARKMIDETESAYNKQVIAINFRDKSKGWRDYCFSTTVEDGSIIQNDALQLYISDYYLRKSCCNCRFKGVIRRSDITLGDFWGVENYFVLDANDLKKGVSVVVIQSAKGNDLLNRISDCVNIFESGIEVFTKGNQAIKTSALKPIGSALGKKLFFNMSITELLTLYQKTNLFRNFYRKANRRMRRFLDKIPKIHIEQRKLPTNKNCCGCMACYAACPFDAIDITTDALGFRYPSVNNEKCKKCGKCIAVCPVIQNNYTIRKEPQ